AGPNDTCHEHRPIRAGIGTPVAPARPRRGAERLVSRTPAALAGSRSRVQSETRSTSRRRKCTDVSCSLPLPCSFDLFRFNLHYLSFLYHGRNPGVKANGI